jgi:hypothetical protein
VEHLPAMRFLAHSVRWVHHARSNAQLLDHGPASPLVHGHRLVQR